MQKWGKRLFLVVFSFIFLFINIGYAKLADALIINGTVSLVQGELQGVVVTSVGVVEGTATNVSCSAVFGTPNAKVKLSGTVGQYVTYEITFRNYDTAIKYAFNQVKSTSSELEDNSYFNNGLTVSVSLPDGTAAAGVSIAPGAELKLYAKYLIGNGAPQSISTILGYEFIVHIDSAGSYAAASSTARFDEILNSDVTYSAEEASALLDDPSITQPMTKMEVLAKIMEGQGGGWLQTGHFVGNVAGSSNLHSSVLSVLFQDDLNMNLYNPETGKVEETEMTCMIKEQDVCGNSTKEMILYMTAEPLTGTCNTQGLFTGYYENRYVSVYAVVFTQSGTEWVQWGDIYSGEANPNNYDGGGRNSAANSFRTDSWRSRADTYEVMTAVPGSDGTTLVPAYSYSIAASQNLKNILSATDATANQRLADLLKVTDDILNGVYGTFAGTAINDLSALKAEIVSYLGSSLTQNANGTYTVASGETRAELVPYISHLRALITPFEDKLGGPN